MQNAFSFASVANATQGSTADKPQNGIHSKSSGGVQDPIETGMFASFLSEWTHVVEKLESDESLTAGSLDLTFSAEQGGTREERTTSLPLDCMNDTLLLSKSVLDLMASIRTDLEEKGVDVDALAGQVGEELEKTLPGMDLERLKAMLSRLQSRYPIAMKSDGARHLDIEVALQDDLTLGLEASLRSPENGAQDTSNTATTEDDEGVDITTPLALSRLYAYLKPDAPRSSSASKTESAESNELQREKKSVSTVQNSMEQTAVPMAVSAPESGASQEKTDDGKNDSLQSKTRVRDEANSAAPKTTEKDENEGTRGNTVVERKSGFEQFFEGIMARRDQADVRPEPMQLAKESPLSRNDALREGLDNVVRFIRTGGEQKASMIVDPPALGRVSVELTNGTTGLEASIKVSSEQVRQLIQDQMAQLRMSLAQQGVQLTHFSVDVQQDNGRQQGGTNRQGRSTRGISGRDDPDDAQDEQNVFRVDLNQGLLWWVA